VPCLSLRVAVAVVIIFGPSMTNIFAKDFSNIPIVIMAIFAMILVTVNSFSCYEQ